MIEEKKITNAQAKKLLYLICQTNDKDLDPQLLAIESGFKAVDTINSNMLRRICETCVDDIKNVNQLRKYRNGNNGLLKYFLGEIMRETNGQFKPKEIESLLAEILKK
jgi:Asp-tRNA(Asn)/Glu-tRNA(Gln) amidotransferase B subunit